MVVSVGIPVAILGGIGVIYMMGNTMNSLVVVGIIIVLGMLVDDAIVVCENIYSYIEKGHSAVESAILGTKEIATPVISSVLTTVFAFAPIIFMKEIIGKFSKSDPINCRCHALSFTFEALIILPFTLKS